MTILITKAIVEIDITLKDIEIEMRMEIVVKAGIEMGLERVVITVTS